MEIDDVCLQCGVHVFDGRPYCCDECESLDSTTSPAISTASSALSSPRLGALNPARTPADVPTLLPSVLGAALRYDRYAPGRYIDLDDDDEDHLSSRVHTESAALSDKQHPYHLAGKMNFTRRSSGTDRRSTIPTVHASTVAVATTISGRTSSSRTTPSEADDEFDLASSPDTARRSALARLQPTSKGRPAAAEIQTPPSGPNATAATAVQKKRNRASLPAYFQLLAVSPNSSSSSALPSRPRVSSPSSTPLSVSIDTPTASRAPPSPVDTLLPRRDLSTLSIHGAPSRGRGRRREIGDSSASRERPRERSQPPRRRLAHSPPHRYEADESEPEAPLQLTVSPILRGRRREMAADEPRRGRRWEGELEGEHGSFGRSGLRARAASPSRERGRGRLAVF